jgi:hypothetical protein
MKEATPRYLANVVLILVTATTGCASRKPPEQPVPHVGTARMDHFQPPATQSPRVGVAAPMVVPPRARTQVLPAYPEAALDEAVACVARILYHVETSGRATLVRLEWAEPPPTQHLEAFEESIRNAVSEWTFHPAVRIEREQRADGSIEGVTTSQPKALHAFVRFRVEDGKAIVE